MQKKRLYTTTIILFIIMTIFLIVDAHREIKQDQFVADKVLPSFRWKMDHIDAIIAERENQVATLVKEIVANKNRPEKVHDIVSNAIKQDPNLLEVRLTASANPLLRNFTISQKSPLQYLPSSFDELHSRGKESQEHLEYNPKEHLLAYKYSINIRDPKTNNYICMLTIKEDLHVFQYILKEIPIGYHTTGYLIDANNHIIADTQAQLIGKEYSPPFFLLQTRNIHSKIVQNEWLDTESNQLLYTISRNIERRPWILHFLIFKEEFLTFTIVDQAYYFGKFVIVSLFVFFALLSLVATNFQHLFNLVFMARLFSFIVIVNILIFNVFRANITTDNQHLVFSPEDVEVLLSSRELINKVQPIPITTVVKITGINFLNPSEVSLSGFVIQKVPKALIDDVEFTIPNLSGGMTNEIRTVSLQPISPEEFLIVKQLNIVLFTGGSHILYPYDDRNIHLTFVPTTTVKPIYFVPSFDYYPSKLSIDLPGVSKEISLQGWQLVESYFSYDYHHMILFRNLKTETPFYSEPSLSFNIVIKRLVLNTFLSNLLPLFIATPLAYLILLLPPHFIRKNMFGVFSYLAAIIFIIVLNHTSIRKNAGISGYSIVENCFLAAYLLIMFFIFSIIGMIVHKKKSHQIFYKDNFILRYVFWPIFLLVVLSVEIVVLFTRHNF